MEVRAQHRNARMAPRKLRTYRQLLKGLSAREATAQLSFMPGEGPAILLKVLRSAIANAQNNFELNATDLKVSDVVIDGGFVMKRFRPVSKGMAHPILKRTSHVTIVIADAGGSAEPAKAKKKADIQDFTMADIASGKIGAPNAKERVDKEVKTDEPKEATPHATKQEEAYGKMKMQQMGGNPKKTHRRKSMVG